MQRLRPPTRTQVTRPHGTPARPTTMCHARAFAVALMLISSPLRAQRADPFWGPDKALHLVAAGAIAGAGYGLTTALSDDRGTAIAVGAGAALGAGALKEGLDAVGLGDPSWKDFAWDVIGAACGLGVAWLLDTAVRGGDAQPLNRASSSLGVAPLQLTF